MLLRTDTWCISLYGCKTWTWQRKGDLRPLKYRVIEECSRLNEWIKNGLKIGLVIESMQERISDKGVEILQRVRQERKGEEEDLD